MTKITSSGILLQSGEYYDYLAPEKNVWTIEDVALGLSNICRYGGQLDEYDWYSVAEHSVYVSYAIDPEFAMDGLLHDLVEFVMGDVPTPLKILLPDYKALEKIHEAEAFKRFGLQYPMVDAVKLADKQVLCAEIDYLKPKSPHWNPLNDIVRYDGEIRCLPPCDAYDLFLNRYYGLINDRLVH